MSDPILFAFLALPLLLGAALFVVLRNGRERQLLQTRLKAMVSSTPAAPGPSLLLRRPQGVGISRASGYSSALLARFNDALAATGNRIGVFHLAIAGLVSASAILLFLVGLLGADPPGAVVLSAAAGVAGSFLLLRGAQRRYQNKFLEIFPH